MHSDHEHISVHRKCNNGQKSNAFQNRFQKRGLNHPYEGANEKGYFFLLMDIIQV